MARTTLFKTNRTQAVRLPKDVAFPEGVRDVDVVALGAIRIIVPISKSWDDWFENGIDPSEDFMLDREQPEMQVREPLD